MEFLYSFLQKLGFDHPLHPPLAHMPAGLIIGAFIFLLTAVALKRHHLRITAYDCMVLALIFFLPTALTGYTDWLHFYHGVWTYPIQMKFILACALFIFLLTGIVLERKNTGGLISKMVVYFLCVLSVVGLGYYGGNLVFGHKITTTPEQLARAEKLYARHCGHCHPAGRNIINAALPVTGSPQLKDLGAFIKFNRNPLLSDGSKGTMPSYPEGQLSDQELKQIYLYATEVLNK